MHPDTGDATVSFEVHGIVRVRLITPRRGDADAVARQLGLPPSAQAAAPGPVALPAGAPQPEIRVRFVDRLAQMPSAYLEDLRIGYGRETFYLRGSEGRGPWVSVPIDRFGAAECEFVAPHGCGGIPLLREAVALAALQRGRTAIHASGFRYGAAGVLVAGWAHSGKTSALLAFAREGATFVGDDQVLLGSDAAMYPTYAPVELADWQLRQLNGAADRAGAGRRVARGGLRALEALLGPGAGGAAGVGTLRSRMDRLVHGIERRLRVRMPADRLCACVEEASVPMTHAAFVTVSAAEDVEVQRCDSREMLQRLLALGRHERLPLVRMHLAYQCAFPGARNDRIDAADDMEASILCNALAGAETLLVRHPRPVALERLHEAMRPLLTAAAQGAVPAPAAVGV